MSERHNLNGECECGTQLEDGRCSTCDPLAKPRLRHLQTGMKQRRAEVDGRQINLPVEKVRESFHNAFGTRIKPHRFGNLSRASRPTRRRSTT